MTRRATLRGAAESAAGGPFTVTIDAALAGARLDRALHAALPGLSRTRLQALLAAGAVTLDNAPCTDLSRKARAGEVFTVTVPAAIDAIPLPQAIPLSIVYEDEALLVIDKAAGMTVHPAPGSPDGTLVNALLAHCGASLSGIGGVRRPGIVHRLDKDTTGLMVAAKTDRAHAALSAQLADRSLSRRYLAMVWGHPGAGRVEAPIGRSPRDRKKMAVTPGAGRAAITDYATLHGVGLHASLVRCQLQTGRTHQIRVHMAHLGFPVVGDPAYGKRITGRLRQEAPALCAFPRQALHAAEIGFIHPLTGAAMRFDAPLPVDMAELIAALSDPKTP